MKRAFALVALLAIGCAHAPRRSLELVDSETRYASDITATVRAAVHAELLASRPAGVSLETRLVGAPHYLGRIDATTTSKTNHEATTPFADTTVSLCGKVLLIQPTAAVSILPVATSTGLVTTTTGVDLSPNERVILTFEDSTTQAFCWLAAITPTSTSSVDVWELF